MERTDKLQLIVVAVTILSFFAIGYWAGHIQGYEKGRVAGQESDAKMWNFTLNKLAEDGRLVAVEPAPK